MSAKLNLAGPDDLDRLLPMVSNFHSIEKVEKSDAQRHAAVLPLLQGSPHGAIWLIGPSRAPVGYIAVSFGWSIELGGMDGFIDEFFIREAVRGRGMGTEVLIALLPELANAGVMALHLEVSKNNASATKLYEKMGFRRRDQYNLMTWVAHTDRSI